jgi:alkanesulfonate monooxygenase SsuD/methylene tetrahydromethanopterin reductase-like flavin-dependent oxidoreductase (luciferase family)
MAGDGALLGRMGMFLFPWGKKAPSNEDLITMAEKSDQLGMHSVHLPYFFALDTDFWPWGNASMIDALALLPYVGAKTSKTRLCLSHWNFSMFHPYLWAQYLSSLQRASHGRAMTTVTLGKRKEDFQVGLSRIEENEDRFTEGFELLRVLLDGETVQPDAFQLWDAAGLRLDPAPETPLDMWVNGKDDATLERTAKFGQYIKPSGMGPDAVREYRPKVAAAGEKHGRTIGLAMSSIVYVVEPDDGSEHLAHVAELLEHERPGGLAGQEYVYGTPEECAEQLIALYRAGVDYVALDLRFHGWETHEFAIEQLNRIAETVAPLVSSTDLPELTKVSP